MNFDDPEKVFQALTKETTLKPLRQNWIIVYKGKPIALSTNGKQVWARPNHALSALTNAYETLMQQQPYITRYKVPYAQRKAELESFKKWRSQNIQIVQQEDWVKNNA